MREDDENEISIGFFSLSGRPLDEEEAAVVLIGGSDIFAKAMLDGERVALVRISTQSGGVACVLWKVVGEATSAEAVGLVLERCTRLLQEYATDILS